MEKLIHKASGELISENPFLKAGLTLQYRHRSIWYTNVYTLKETLVLRAEDPDDKRVFMALDKRHAERSLFGLARENDLTIVND